MPRRYKEARIAKNLKVSDVTEILGISQPTLSAWERGVKNPTIENLESLADLYGVTTDYLLGRDSHSINSPVQLNISDLQPGMEVLVEPISNDMALKQMLKGIYVVKDRYVENLTGNRFFFDTYTFQWIAYKVN